MRSSIDFHEVLILYAFFLLLKCASTRLLWFWDHFEKSQLQLRKIGIRFQRKYFGSEICKITIFFFFFAILSFENAQFWFRGSLIFRRICNMRKNYSFSKVVFLFQSKIANSFYSKINDSSGVRTSSWSDRSGFQSLPCQIFLWFHWHLSEFAIVPMAHWVGQHGSEAVGSGSSLCRAKYFYDFTDIFQIFQWFSWHSG